MTYTEQTWVNSSNASPAGGLSAERLGHIETGISDAGIAAAAASTAAAASIQRVPFVDIRTEGALIDGTTDDYTAVQASINIVQSAGGGIVFHPGGICKVNTALSVTLPSVAFWGGGWDQSTTTCGSIYKAGAAMTDLVNATSAGSTLSTMQVSLDCAGLATNGFTIDGLNSQFIRTHVRNPATNGTGFNVTANGTSPWFTDCRFNGANRSGCVGFSIAGTDSTMTGCKAVNCLDSVQYLSGSSGAIQQGCHHTPGSTIGRCCINIAGNGSNIQLVGNRIDNHALGSGIQVTPSANIVGIQIVGNLFYQNVITDATFAAIGLDYTSAHIYQTIINSNIIRSASSHNYTALLTSQKLDGTASSTPTRASSDGTTVSGNSVYAAAMFGTSSSPLMGRGNVLSTNGTTWAVSTDVG